MTESMNDDIKTSQAAEGGIKINQRMFYGRNKKVTLPIDIRIKRRVRDIKKKHTPTAYKSRLTGPCTSWKTFHRQKDAFDFVTSSNQELRVWSYESDAFVENHGQRLYLAASPQQFWHYYRQLDPFQRHHYEVIPEGAACRLYFDLEYSTAVNPSLDGPRMVAIFIQFVCYQLKKIYDVCCTKEDVLQLDASISTKFSQHLTFRLDKVAFKDNSHAGGFVEYVCTVIEDITNNVNHPSTELSQPEKENSFPNSQLEETRNHPISNNSATSLTTPCAKYSAQYPSSNKNLPQNQNDTTSSQSVRSELLGERTVNAGATREQIPRSPSRDDCIQMLKESGLSASDLDSLFVKDKQGKRVIFCDRGVYTKNRNFRLYMSCKLGKANPLVLAPTNTYRGTQGAVDQEQVFYDSLVCSVRFDENVRLLSSEGTSPSRSQRSSSSQQHAGKSNQATADGFSSKSPYAEVDAFVTSLVSSGGRHGNIRRWSYFQDAELLIYDIAGNRWCHNIGRQQRSNNIMIVVDLQRGVYYQKCHDPECKAANYKSQDWPLPAHILPSNILDNDEDFPEQSANTLPKDDADNTLSDDILRQIDIDLIPVSDNLPRQANINPSDVISDVTAISDDILRHIDINPTDVTSDVTDLSDDVLRHININSTDVFSDVTARNDNIPHHNDINPTDVTGDITDLSDNVLRHININPTDVTGDITAQSDNILCRNNINPTDVGDVWDPLSYDDILVTESSLEEEADDALLMEAAAAVDSVNSVTIQKPNMQCQDFDGEEIESDLLSALNTYEKSFSEKD